MQSMFPPTPPLSSPPSLPSNKSLPLASHLPPRKNNFQNFSFSSHISNSLSAGVIVEIEGSVWERYKNALFP